MVSGMMFGGFSAIFIIVFVIVIGGILFTIIKGISNYTKNASSPILTTRAKVVAKRINVTHHDNFDGEHHHDSTSTRYYVTFETEAGQRMELVLSGREYGLLVEGDEGELIYQGEWFKQFNRTA